MYVQLARGLVQRAATELELSVRLRQRLRDRGAAGRAAGRPQLAAAVRLRPLRRAAQRLALHRAARAPTSAPGSTASGRRCSTGAGSRRPTSACGAPRPAPRSRCRSRRCAGTRSRSRTRRCRSSRACAPSPRRATPARQAGMGAHVYLVTRSMEDEYFYNADGEMLFVPQQGALRFCDRVRHHRRRARRDRRHPARRQVPRRAAGRPGARLHLRELRRHVHAARARPDRRQLPGQPARLPDAGRGLRGHATRRRSCS